MKVLFILMGIIFSNSHFYGEYYLIYSDVDCIMEKNESNIKFNILKDGQGFFEVDYESFGNTEYEFFGWKSQNDTIVIVYHDLGQIDQFAKIRSNTYKNVSSNYYLVKKKTK